MSRTSQLGRIIGLALVGMALCPGAVRPVVAQEVELVVLVSVDQLRGDLLERYAQVFDGGFRRLMDGGVRFSNATHDHARTETAPGHVTLATGVYPSIHGIVGNTFFVPDEDRQLVSTYCMADPEAPLLGFPAMPGRSWKNVQRDGLADWVRLQNPEAEVVSISRKDRSAIGMGGRGGGHIYWIVERAGVFTTSTSYRWELPDWVEGFNASTMATLYADSVWEGRASPEGRSLSRPDTAAFEGDGEHTFFDHRAWEETDPTDPGRYGVWMARTPVGDQAVRLLGQEAVTRLRMGQRGGMDFLALGFSSADYIGHRYGPLSREQLENLLRLDEELGNLMAFLDERVGVDRWAMALSADHGVMDQPGSRSGVRRATREEIREMNQITQTVVNRGGDPRPGLIENLSALDIIGGVSSRADLAGGEALDSIATLQRNSHFRSRYRSGLGAYGVEIYPAENLILSTGARGTSHGSPWHYDRWVPLMFFGPGVASGVREDRAATVDLAPTLAGIAGLSVPSDLTGKDLLVRR